MNLKDKVIVITGASRGLGKALALQLGTKSCHLFLTARSRQLLDVIASDINNLGSKVTVIDGDLTKPETREKIQETVYRRERLDVLINNAGIMITKPFLESTPEEIERIFAINTLAHLHLTLLLLPIMKRRNYGTIVNISSFLGKEGRANQSLYCASKFAITGFTDALRKELKPYNIKVQGVYPGGIATHLFDNVERPYKPKKKNLMDPKDVAGLIVASLETNDNTRVDELVLNRMKKE